MLTKDQKLLIAQFYDEHRVEFNNASRKPDRKKIVDKLYEKMTEMVNAIMPPSGQPKSIDQIREALKKMKQSAKNKVTSNNKSASGTGGGSDGEDALEEHEELMASGMRNTPSYIGVPGGGIESGGPKSSARNLHSGLYKKNQQYEEQSSEEDLLGDVSLNQASSTSLNIGTECHAYTQESLVPSSSYNAPSTSFTQPIARPVSTKTTKRSTTSVIDSGAAKSAKKANMGIDQKEETRKLQAEVLQLQKEVYSQFKETLNEARAMIFEKRLRLRGVDVSKAPVDAPPGVNIDDYM